MADTSRAFARAAADERRAGALESAVAKASVIDGLFGEGSPPQLGRYALRSLLGSGAHGQVYVADDPQLGRQVAIKLVETEPGPEAEALAQLSHPNVVSVFDLGVDADQAYIVMELVDGRDLARVLREDVPDPARIVEMFVDAGRGLAAAHAVGLVHRDFKPTNVLVTPKGAAKVADFGLARVEPTPPTSEPRTDTSAAGTVAYMAPEQHAGRRVDAKADQYAFCVALWEALTGDLPFAGPTPDALEQAKRGGLAARVPASVPRELGLVLRRGLSADPADRFESMNELLAAMPGHGRRWGLAAGLGLAFVGAIAAATFALRREPECEVAPLRFTDADAITAAFAATGLVAGPSQAQRVNARLDTFVVEWNDARATVCATRANAAMLGCLDRGTVEFEALVETLAAADADAVGRAWSAAASLPDPEQCLSAEPEVEPLSPQEVDVERRIARARALEKAGRIAEGLAQAQRAHDRAADLPPRTRIKASFRLGRLQAEAERFEESRETLAACFFEAREAGDFALAGAAATHVANAALSLRDTDDALTWIRHADAELVRAGDPPGHRGPLLIARGRYAAAQGDAAAAVAALDEAMALTPDAERIPAVLTSRGHAHMEAGDLDAAEADLRRALQMRAEQSGPDHPLLFGATNNLALLLQRRGDVAGAREMLERAYELAVAGNGPQSPRAHKALVNLGQLAFAQDDYAAAVDYNRRALKGRIEAHGPDHASVAIPQLNLGNALLAQGRPSEAAEHHRESLRIFERTRGPDHPHVAYALTGLGAALREVGRADEAIALLERAVAIREATGAAAGSRAESWHELGLALMVAKGRR